MQRKRKSFNENPSTKFVAYLPKKNNNMTQKKNKQVF